MKNALLVLGMVLAIAIGSTKRAEACGGGGSGGDYSGLVAAALVVGGSYAGVTLGMGIKDLSSDDHSIGYGIAETAIHAPIAVLWGMGFAAEVNKPETANAYGYTNGTDRDAATGYAIMTVIHGALAAHGIYTIAKDRSKKKERGVSPGRPYQGPPGMFSVGRVSASVAPAPMQNGAGLGLAGSF